MKNYITHILTLILLSSIILTGAASAEEIKFEASLDRNIISLGQSTQLNLKFTDSKNVPEPDIPKFDGLQSRYVGPSTMMSFVNGRMTSSVTHIYRLVPLKTGTFTIGPITFEHKDNTYVSNGLTLEVVDSGQHQAVPSQRQRQARETALKERLFLDFIPAKTKGYLNEIIPVTIRLYVSGLRIQDIQYPEFLHEGFSAGEFDKPRQYQENKTGVTFNVVEFKTSIFGTKEGKFLLGPAKLRANMMTRRQAGRGRSPFDDFFGGYETEPVGLTSGSPAITILPVPKENRPPDFKGAIGDFRFDVVSSPAKVKLGDPVTLKMTITGSGNFNTVTSPVLEQNGDFKTYEPQAKLEGNKKTFEQVLIPTTDDVNKVPAISFSFFNPVTGSYQTITKKDLPLTVLKPEQKEEIAILESPQGSERLRRKETFGKDIIFIKESAGALTKKGAWLYRNPAFLLLQTVPIILFVSAWTFRRHREKLSTDIGYARRLSAPKKARKGMRRAQQHLDNNSIQEFYDSVFKTLREYLGDRFHFPSGGITADDIDRVMKDRGISTDIMDTLKDICRECDMARYAPSELGAGNMETTFKKLREAIDSLERHKG